MISRRRAAAVVLAASLASACGWMDAGKPMVVAHRSGAGNWPENSRTAVRSAIARRYPGIEFDLILTKDRIPVISHEPDVYPLLCTRADGSPLPAERILIKDLTLAELQAGFRCGGLRNPDHPNAEPVADTYLTLDELIDEVRAVPQMLLHFDVKYDPVLTLDAQAFAAEIVGRWRAAGLPNPWYASCNEPACIQALRAQGAEAMLTWPKFAAGENSTAGGIRTEIVAQLGLTDAITQARSAGASGLNMAYQLIDRRIIDAAQREGMKIQVWTVDSAAALGTYCRWPEEILITDYPERAPCLSPPP